MKNEDRILKLLVEALQRIDQHSEQIEQHAASIKNQQQINFDLLVQIQKQQEITGKHNESIERHSLALVGLKERTEAIHQSSLEQQRAYQAMTELLMFHNQALRAKDIL